MTVISLSEESSNQYPHRDFCILIQLGSVGLVSRWINVIGLESMLINEVLYFLFVLYYVIYRSTNRPTGLYSRIAQTTRSQVNQDGLPLRQLPNVKQ